MILHMLVNFLQNQMAAFSEFHNIGCTVADISDCKKPESCTQNVNFCYRTTYIKLVKSAILGIPTRFFLNQRINNLFSDTFSYIKSLLQCYYIYMDIGILFHSDSCIFCAGSCHISRGSLKAVKGFGKNDLSS